MCTLLASAGLEDVGGGVGFLEVGLGCEGLESTCSPGRLGINANQGKRRVDTLSYESVPRVARVSDSLGR